MEKKAEKKINLRLKIARKGVYQWKITKWKLKGKSHINKCCGKTAPKIWFGL